MHIIVVHDFRHVTDKKRSTRLFGRPFFFLLFTFIRRGRSYCVQHLHSEQEASAAGGMTMQAALGSSNPNVISPPPKMGPHKVSAEQQSLNCLANETFLKNEVAANLGDATR